MQLICICFFFVDELSCIYPAISITDHDEAGIFGTNTTWRNKRSHKYRTIQPVVAATSYIRSAHVALQKLVFSLTGLNCQILLNIITIITARHVNCELHTMYIPCFVKDIRN